MMNELTYMRFLLVKRVKMIFNIINYITTKEKGSKRKLF